MPINIHGKQYNTVAERINAAGDDLLKVNTEVLFTDPQVVIKATITTKKGTFTGISAANAAKQIEKESPYEVAETSAVGRALAFAGYESSDGIASAEEMKKVEGIAPKVNTLGTCPKCGAAMRMSQTGKPYCSALCWKNPTPTQTPEVNLDEVEKAMESLPF